MKQHQASRYACILLMLAGISACGGGSNNNAAGSTSSASVTAVSSSALSTSSLTTSSLSTSAPSNSSLSRSSLSASAVSSRSGSQSSSSISAANVGLLARPSNTTCAAPAVVNAGTAANIRWQAAFPSLPNIPVPSSMFQLPGENSFWYVLRQSGLIVRFANQAGANSVSSVLNIEGRVEFGGSDGDETGLLGVAVHPQFVTNRFVFLYYTGRPSSGGLETRVARFTVNNDGSFDPNSELIFMRISRPYSNHLGGQLAFDNEGYLYIGSGDGGSGGDPHAYGQNLNTLLGKVLRIDINKASGDKLYSIPTDNPFIGQSNTREEIWAWGIRNPWRFSFDRETNELWLGDVGQGAWEEVNLISRGGNYGWGDMEGNGCYSGRSNCSTLNKIKPLHVLNHSTGACSVIGGYVYRGTRYPSAIGKYFYTDFCEHTMRSITRTATSSITLETQASLPASIVSFAQDNQGELYAIGQSSGVGTQIYSLQVITGGEQPGVMASTLSATGCVLANDPTKPATGMIPFAVQSPLWSDGAGKERYLALPENRKIDLTASGDFNFPVGSVLMKHFTLNNRFIETRLFTLGALGWQGFSYEWLDDQSDALLLSDYKDKTIGNLVWHYPSQGQCMKCHTRAAGFALGAETLQLNGNLTYLTTGTYAQQLTTLESIGLFSTALSNAQKTEKLFSLDNAQATLQNRARSYLHSNCSGCHRPDGQTPTSLDLRFTTLLADTRSCNIVPHEGDLGIANARIVVPGEPQRSVLIARMQASNDTQMPPLNRAVIDTDAINLISEWIGSLGSCSQ